MNPFVPWDVDESFSNHHVVWWGKLDERYLIEVRRVCPYIGHLYIFNHADNDREIANWTVTISYNARFGPDVADVAEWQDTVENYIREHPPESRPGTMAGAPRPPTS